MEALEAMGRIAMMVAWTIFVVWLVRGIIREPAAMRRDLAEETDTPCPAEATPPPNGYAEMVDAFAEDLDAHPFTEPENRGYFISGPDADAFAHDAGVTP